MHGSYQGDSSQIFAGNFEAFTIQMENCLSGHLSLVTLWRVWVSFSGWLEHRFSDILIFSLVKFLTDGSPKLLPGSQLREGTGVVLLQSVKVHAASIPTWNVHEDAPPFCPLSGVCCLSRQQNHQECGGVKFSAPDHTLCQLSGFSRWVSVLAVRRTPQVSHCLTLDTEV